MLMPHMLIRADYRRQEDRVKSDSLSICETCGVGYAVCGRRGAAKITTAASLPWPRGERPPGRQLRCHEGIAAADVAAEVLRRITIDELTTKHRMGHATDFVLNGEQLTAGLGVDDILEAILIVIAFLGNEIMLLQERVRA